MENVADAGVLIRIGLQPADFEDQLAIAVIEDANLGVGRLAVVDVTESAADANDTLGQLILAQAPAGDIHLVNALIAQVAVAVIPNPVPIIMQMFAHERLDGRRTAPEIVVDRLGDRLFSIDFPNAVPGLVA